MLHTSINIRVPVAIKEKAQKVAKKNGISLTTAIRFFLTDLSEDQYKARLIPTPLAVKNYPPALVDEIIRETEKAKKLYAAGKRKSYTSAEALFADLDRDT